MYGTKKHKVRCVVMLSLLATHPTDCSVVHECLSVVFLIQICSCHSSMINMFQLYMPHTLSLFSFIVCKCLLRWCCLSQLSKCIESISEPRVMAGGRLSFPIFSVIVAEEMCSLTLGFKPCTMWCLALFTLS